MTSIGDFGKWHWHLSQKQNGADRAKVQVVHAHIT